MPARSQMAFSVVPSSPSSARRERVASMIRCAVSMPARYLAMAAHLPESNYER
jgi:hypothetical protein